MSKMSKQAESLFDGAKVNYGNLPIYSILSKPLLAGVKTNEYQRNQSEWF